MKKFLLFIGILSTVLVSFLYAGSCLTLADSGFCTKAMYRNLMCTVCSQECNNIGGYNSCILPTPSPDCQDKSTNCPSLAHLCTNMIYRGTLAHSCSSTCNTCDGKPATIPPPSTTNAVVSSSKGP